MATIGFSQVRWTTSNSAEQLAQHRASAAVVSALVPFCVAKAQQDPDKTEVAGYSRSDMVMKAGWATLGNEKSPDNALAWARSEELNAAKAG